MIIDETILELAVDMRPSEIAALVILNRHALKYITALERENQDLRYGLNPPEIKTVEFVERKIK